MKRTAHLGIRFGAVAAAITGPLLWTGGFPEKAALRVSIAPPPAALPQPTPAAASLSAMFAAAELSPDEPSDRRPELVGVIGRLPHDVEVLVRTAGEATRTLRVGGAVDGWTLRAIGADRAVFARGERQHVATLAPLP